MASLTRRVIDSLAINKYSSWCRWGVAWWPWRWRGGGGMGGHGAHGLAWGGMGAWVGLGRHGAHGLACGGMGRRGSAVGGVAAVVGRHVRLWVGMGRHGGVAVAETQVTLHDKKISCRVTEKGTKKGASGCILDAPMAAITLVSCSLYRPLALPRPACRRRSCIGRYTLYHILRFHFLAQSCFRLSSPPPKAPN